LLSRVSVTQLHRSSFNRDSDSILLRPEWRNRSFFIGAAVGKTHEIIADVKSLVAHFSDNPKCHHLDTCLDAPSPFPVDLDPNLGLTARDLVRRDEQYAEAFRIAFNKAGVRVKDAVLRPRPERMSAKANLVGSPWLLAQTDVYEMIIESLLKTSNFNTETPHFHPVADVGQSTHRGAVCVQGTIPSLSTSSKIFSYKLKRSGAQLRFSSATLFF
jgi:hypothetical protein